MTALADIRRAYRDLPVTDARFTALLARLVEALSPRPSPVVTPSDGASGRPPIASLEATPDEPDGLQ